MTLFQAAFETFRSCIKAFPFFKAKFVEQARCGSITALLDSSPSHKHIVEIIDRMSYMGLCDLFLSTEEVSVGILLAKPGADPKNGERDTLDRCMVIGVLLERQAEGLMESKWKPAIRSSIARLLQEAIQLYGPQDMPVRRARAIFTSLGLTVLADGGWNDPHELEELAQQAEGLLQSEVCTKLVLCLPDLTSLLCRTWAET